MNHRKRFATKHALAQHLMRTISITWRMIRYQLTLVKTATREQLFHEDPRISMTFKSLLLDSFYR